MGFLPESLKKSYNVIDGRQTFLDTLLYRCRVLWHESIDEEKEVFVRPNSPKIPLAEAENIVSSFRG
ncbi:hypothetical protein [Helicobacter gastrocanis]|uniref:hypothetical protein n=1 Tax=Helicobacter gastrocanis TaxID=2849641 RepID=UPI001C84360B|nr:hypothetical protein [Helicobacter sp. NHP19-003]